MAHLLALDQGTTSSRSLVFGPNGEIKALAQKEFRQDRKSTRLNSSHT